MISCLFFNFAAKVRTFLETTNTFQEKMQLLRKKVVLRRFC